MRRVTTDPDIAASAALIGDPSRAAILFALADGRALPAGELARLARISPQTASSHLDRLFRGKLLTVEVQGRHHYYRLRDERVAQVIEGLAGLAPPAPALTPMQRRDARELRFARTCYGHLAGRLGVAVTQALCATGLLEPRQADFAVTTRGAQWMRLMGVELASLRADARRPLTRRCLDWSERRPHLAGALGVALTRRMLDLGWIARARQGRVVRLTACGRAALKERLSLTIEPGETEAEGLPGKLPRNTALSAPPGR